MVKKKTKSKRLSLHKKYKIARKVREHKRQERKKEKNGLGRKKKDPGIPNNWPFKEELLLQVEQARLAELESQHLAKEQRKQEKKEKKRLAKLQGGSSNQFQELTPLSVEMQHKKDLKEAVQKSDIVFIVLDARDPQGSRSLSLEDGLIAKGNKKVVLVLNKIDLIAAETAEKWVNYLRRFHPTIPVRSVNETVVEMKQKTKAAKGQQALYNRTQEINGIRDNGNVEPLRVLLNSLSQQWKEESAMKIALVGYPNVGKSTLLNSLKKKALSNVSSYARATKRSFEVQFNDKITLIDTPALDVDYSDESAVILRHGIAASFVEDAVPAIKDLLERGDAVNLMQNLQIPIFKDHEDFLKKLALKRNLLRKGGDPDILNSARTFLRNLGNGTYHTSCLPPTKSKSRFEMPEWYKSLDLKELEKREVELYSSNRRDQKRVINFRACTLSHAAGDTTEFDLLYGKLPECDGLTSDEENDDGDEDDDEEEEEEVEEEEDQDDDDDDDVDEEDEEEEEEEEEPKEEVKAQKVEKTTPVKTPKKRKSDEIPTPRKSPRLASKRSQH